MDWVILAGALSFGVILGWMAYVVFAAQSNLRIFTAIVGIFGGAVVAGIFQAIAGTKSALPREVWFYPVGLLVGIAITASIRGYQTSGERREQQRERERIEREQQREQERTEKEQQRERDRVESLRQREMIKDAIVVHMTSKRDYQSRIPMITFDTLRTEMGKENEWTDDFLGQLILEYHNIFYNVTEHGRRGIALISSR
jgi:hypothetical protein